MNAQVQMTQQWLVDSKADWHKGVPAENHNSLKLYAYSIKQLRIIM
jgi:hypothetical protein